MNADNVAKRTSLRTHFGDALGEMAKSKDFYVVDMDVAGGTGLGGFVKSNGERVVQCGIAEQAGLGIAAGLSLSGTPVVWSTFAVFGLRAIEIARLSVAFAGANVKMVMSHVGLDTGEDGASAQSLGHYGYWRSLPNVEVLHPVDKADMTSAVKYMLSTKRATVLFTGRSPSPSVYTGDAPIYRYGKADFIYDTSYPDVVIVGAGGIMGEARIAADRLRSEGVKVCLVNVRSIKPFDAQIVSRYKNAKKIVTVEDGYKHTGIYSILASELYAAGGTARLIPIGVDDVFGESGSRDDLYEKYNLCADSIYEVAK